MQRAVRRVQRSATAAKTLVRKHRPDYSIISYAALLVMLGLIIIFAIGSGGLFGVGIGNSVQAAGYLPEAINDSIFAILGETFGFAGLMVILWLFYMLLRQIIRMMERLPDPRYQLLVAGVFGWITSHVVINIAAMIGLIPLTGITLPFLSFGGTSMVFMAAALGLVFQVSQFTVHKSEIKEINHEDSRSRRRVGRTRYAGRRGSR